MSDNILSQNLRQKSSWKNTSTPDTDSNNIQLASQGTSVIPDFEFSHNFAVYNSPVGNVQPVIINAPIRAEDRSLIVITLDNSNNTGSKTFTFTGTYDFLDEPGVLAYTLAAGAVKVWYGSVYSGRVCLRKGSDSTL
jgi:hypothetical protein